jgi:hypothetical protein
VDEEEREGQTVNVNVTATAFLYFTGCRMSRYIFGNTACPPHGDMSRPKEMGKVSQFSGNRYV